MRSPLFSPRWIGIHLVALLVAAVCVAGTAWQFARAFEPDREVITNPAEDLADAVPLEGLLEPGEYLHPDSFANTAVTVSGRYAPEDLLLVPRQQDGVRGHDVILPLVTAEGAAVTIGRGWVPEGAEIPEVTTDEVTVTGWLLPPVKDGGFTPIATEEGTIERIATSLLVNEWDHPLYEGYVVLPEGDPAAEGLTPVPPPEPPTGLTVNWRSLSYTVQWAMFGVSGMVFWILTMRRELADARDDAGAPSASEEAPAGEDQPAAAGS
ncbi:SURF1 family protein [Nocardiopsis sp. N85]|uniref:SURF1 family protein n=1 Tax=Nocardiopsis sp. N85 TaxID=3029400 RepID=UPI00237F107B|nr:SURF1 family protein [Nocardiopsis sp. N85]MDE3723012.1 SURF1 family protein [Nocardiopsis sp. N85]